VSETYKQGDALSELHNAANTPEVKEKLRKLRAEFINNIRSVAGLNDWTDDEIMRLCIWRATMKGDSQ
jgi:hypothetical protein